MKIALTFGVIRSDVICYGKGWFRDWESCDMPVNSFQRHAKHLGLSQRPTSVVPVPCGPVFYLFLYICWFFFPLQRLLFWGMKWGSSWICGKVYTWWVFVLFVCFWCILLDLNPSVTLKYLQSLKHFVFPSMPYK